MLSAIMTAIGTLININATAFIHHVPSLTFALESASTCNTGRIFRAATDTSPNTRGTSINFFTLSIYLGKSIVTQTHEAPHRVETRTILGTIVSSAFAFIDISGAFKTASMKTIVAYTVKTARRVEARAVFSIAVITNVSQTAVSSVCD